MKFELIEKLKNEKKNEKKGIQQPVSGRINKVDHQLMSVKND